MIIWTRASLLRGFRHKYPSIYGYFLQCSATRHRRCFVDAGAAAAVSCLPTAAVAACMCLISNCVVNLASSYTSTIIPPPQHTRSLSSVTHAAHLRADLTLLRCFSPISASVIMPLLYGRRQSREWVTQSDLWPIDPFAALIGGIKRCCDPFVCLSLAFSDSPPFARWRYTHVVDRGEGR